MRKALSLGISVLVGFSCMSESGVGRAQDVSIPFTKDDAAQRHGRRIQLATLANVKRFFDTWYDPANASVVVAGDFDTAKARDLVDRWLGSIPSRGKPVDPSAGLGSAPFRTTLTTVVRKILPDDVEMAKRFSVSRGPGLLVSYASVATDQTGEALSAMLSDLRQFSEGGLSDDEIARTRSQARATLVDTYESVEGIAGRLSSDASLGLGPDYEARAVGARDEAQRPLLDTLAKRYYSPDGALLLVIGPRARVRPMLDALGLPAPEIRDAEGTPIR